MLQWGVIPSVDVSPSYNPGMRKDADGKWNFCPPLMKKKQHVDSKPPSPNTHPGNPKPPPKPNTQTTRTAESEPPVPAESCSVREQTSRPVPFARGIHPTLRTGKKKKSISCAPLLCVFGGDVAQRLFRGQRIGLPAAHGYQ
ncbi:hypothetical protein JTE90_019386 [Oedothorax gibbosus]|uniref:Uncharacterized protein n=1 Tax=Oedothorax gibbosus TaxID=931172 RepID=A0AAV6UAV6_9ARAC|nr:hypothetical protein JTE90_019386 [Oedothorax gibbosus]